MKPNESDMHPVLLERYKLWKEKCDVAGINAILTCVLRTFDEQSALYAQGRADLEAVNELRKRCGMYPITAKENTYQVTWTMNSRHMPKGNSPKSRAFDFAIIIPGKKNICWDTKWDADHDGVPEYLECARLAKECGLVSGAFWKKPDFPHVELPEDVV